MFIMNNYNDYIIIIKIVVVCNYNGWNIYSTALVAFVLENVIHNDNVIISFRGTQSHNYSVYDLF